MPEPLRLYCFADAPPELQALSDLGGGEQVLVITPAGWLDDTAFLGLPHVLSLLLVGDMVRDWMPIERAWGAVQRVAMDDGRTVIIVARP